MWNGGLQSPLLSQVPQSQPQLQGDMAGAMHYLPQTPDMVASPYASQPGRPTSSTASQRPAPLKVHLIKCYLILLNLI